MKYVYVKLLEEGTEAYRPVPALLIESNIYKLLGHKIHDPLDEIWEFLPDTIVQTKVREIVDKKLLIAVKAVED